MDLIWEVIRCSHPWTQILTGCTWSIRPSPPRWRRTSCTPCASPPPLYPRCPSCTLWSPRYPRRTARSSETYSYQSPRESVNHVLHSLKYYIDILLWTHLNILQGNDASGLLVGGELEVIQAVVIENEPPPLPALVSAALLPEPSLLVRIEEGVHEVISVIFRDLERLRLNAEMIVVKTIVVIWKDMQHQCIIQTNPEPSISPRMANN